MIFVFSLWPLCSNLEQMHRMKIAVNTRFLLPDQMEGYGYFIHETFRRITQSHPEHEFIFIFDRPYHSKFIYAQNITPVVVQPSARHPLLWKFWFDIRIPSVLKKYGVNAFVSPDGFCSLNTTVPQCLVLHDLSFLHFPSFIKKSHLLFYKHYTARFLEKSKSIATVSEFSKKDIIEHYGIDEKKIDVVFSAAKDIFKPLNRQDSEEIKKQYTEGKEFFLHTGAIHPRKNLENLLKAFSVFKKRQQSSMKLVLAGRLAWKYDSLITKLKTYKYRNDVILLDYINEDVLAKITASAYALIYPSFFEGFGVPVLEAFQCEVPVITSSGSSMQEIAGDASLYADPENYTELAEKMMQLYKDELLRTSLIKKASNVVSQYTWDNTSQLLWQTIKKAIV